MRLDIDFNHQFYECILHRQTDKAEKLMVKHFELTRAFRAEDFKKTWGKKDRTEIISGET
jgi:DNA-binding GntR family transcriptional regulator